MIELGSEPVFPLAEVPERLHRLRAGKKLHKATAYRWANRGVAGIRLRTLRVGGTLCTSVGSLQDFCRRLTALRDPGEAAPTENTKTSPRLPKEDVEKRLGEIGL